MKNIQIIDGAANCSYDIYRVSDDKFRIIFPMENQNVEFAEDIEMRLAGDVYEKLFDGFWDNRIDKTKVQGIHGTLFYELEFKKKFYPTKNDNEMSTALSLI